MTAEVCDRLGWGYALVSDISVMEHRNLRFLSGYRYDRWISVPATARICASAGEERTLGEWAELLADVCAQPLGAVYSALWWRQLRADEDRPLSLSTAAEAA